MLWVLRSSPAATTSLKVPCQPNGRLFIVISQDLGGTACPFPLEPVGWPSGLIGFDGLRRRDQRRLYCVADTSQPELLRPLQNEIRPKHQPAQRRESVLPKPLPGFAIRNAGNHGELRHVHGHVLYLLGLQIEAVDHLELFVSGHFRSIFAC